MGSVGGARWPENRPPMSSRILIVDDDPVQRRLLEAAAMRLGHSAVTLDNGRAAVEMLAGPDGDRFHLMILDLVMPELDGMGVLERLPALGRTLPVIVQTAHGGIVIHGRSDATLNPGGVRIGTAEIYNQVEQMPEILEALCIGQDFDNDVRVVLFVRLAAGVQLDEDLEKRIRTRIRSGASPRHVPARIVAVADIPRTKSGKITELAVRDVVHGRAVKNKEALANPEALDLFRDLPQLAQ